MNLLNACLALVLTLGVFASVVTVLVEMIHQALQQRARDLKGMLGFVFDQAVSGKKLKAPGLDVAALRKNFAETLRSDKVLGELVKNHGFILKLVAKRIANASSMNIEDLLRRLPRSDVYQKFIKDLAPDEREKVVQALVEQFGRSEKAISEFFRVRAKLLSFLVGACLALFVNVDAVRLFEYFAANPAETEQAITRLQGLLAEAQKEGKADVPPQTNTAAADPTPTSQERAEEIAAMLNRLRNSQAFGLPVGWAYYPYCLPSAGAGKVDPQCRKEESRQPEAKHVPAAGQGVSVFLADVRENGRPFLWFVSAIVTGFLIGLGGPYWFDLAMSLSRLRDILKTGRPPAQEQAPKAPDPDALVAAFLEKEEGAPGGTA